MKQRSIQFSAMFVIFLLLGIGYAFAEPIHLDTGNMSANVTYSETGPFRPGDVVNITADFNKSVDNASILFTNVSGSDLGNETLMTKIDNDSFGFDYEIPEAILTDGPLGVNISPLDANGSNMLGEGEFFSDPDAFELDPETDSSVNITYSKTNVIPFEAVTITADFNTTVDHANISITNNTGSSLVNESMSPLDAEDNSFVYNYTIPLNIISGNLGVDINAYDGEGGLLLNGEPLANPNAFVFGVDDYLNISIGYNKTSPFRPGDIVNIIANFSQPIDHANISIGNGLPGVSNVNLVGADFVTNEPMDPIDDDTFAYDFEVPDDVSGPLDIGISGFDDLGNLLGEESFPGDFNVNPYITIISPDTEFAAKKCVAFNFTAYDMYDDYGSQLTYTFSLDGAQKSSGVITPGAYKKLEFELADGYHTWEISTRDSYGNTHTTGSRDLYVDTKCPSVILTSPQDCYKELIGATQFNFTCEDALAAQYSDLDLSYQLYIDGQLAENFSGYSLDEFSGSTNAGESIVKELELPDGAHNWSVYVEDGAGNSATSKVRDFYVSLDGLSVSLVSPDGGYVSSNPTFTFTVEGSNGYGVGLPFTYKLLVDGEEVDESCYQDEDLTCCTDEDCDCGDFVVGDGSYSITAAVKDGVNKKWTVVITDCTSGRTYQPDVKSFSVDSIAPACVANLNVEDALGQTFWQYVNDYPGLMVSWNASTDEDLADMPYEVYISTSKPSCIEDMQKVNTTGLETHTDGSETPNQKLENSSVTDLCIEAIDGKDLVYGKDYWVAVIARDNASNYNSKFSMCGPVRTYEDMTIALDDGWNLKSVPKELVSSKACTEDVFGNDSTVLYWDGSCWQFPETIEPCKGYWVYTEEPFVTNVQFRGMSSDSTKPSVPASLTLTPGWHMIGHTSSYYAPWSTSLASLNEFNTDNAENYRFSNLITYQGTEGWGGIIPGAFVENETGVLKYVGDITDSRPVGALDTDGQMVPGQGYWIFMKGEGTYASIENAYKPNIEDQSTSEDDFNPWDSYTWPDDFNLFDQNTWPEGFDPFNESTWV
ncbi:hypothetical protein MSBRW_2638 [Methanosarcina barkeri str. Wiesmoor]|uniref:Uncharacterized protein n=2 Tax=Methanosarcina barkeri TaxID=2208 RepID=A0A0E3LLU7_METBA|nr:hypothetical protein [Methanosarcina barkeri]AKB51891.1 hypothetical protein MSBRW_2638 [Methanosarcina barkeri str. Wiesmoor]